MLRRDFVIQKIALFDAFFVKKIIRTDWTKYRMIYKLILPTGYYIKENNLNLSSTNIQLIIYTYYENIKIIRFYGFMPFIICNCVCRR